MEKNIMFIQNEKYERNTLSAEFDEAFIELRVVIRF